MAIAVLGTAGGTGTGTAAAAGRSLLGEIWFGVQAVSIRFARPTRLTRTAITAAILATAILAARFAATAAGVSASLTSVKGSTK